MSGFHITPGVIVIALIIGVLLALVEYELHAGARRNREARRQLRRASAPGGWPYDQDRDWRWSGSWFDIWMRDVAAGPRYTESPLRWSDGYTGRTEAPHAAE